MKLNIMVFSVEELDAIQSGATPVIEIPIDQVSISYGLNLVMTRAVKAVDIQTVGHAKKLLLHVAKGE